MLVKRLLLIFFSFTSLLGIAQEKPIIHGKITTSVGEPIPFAFLSLDDQTHAISDENGTFVIQPVSAGSYSLTAKAMGYRTANVFVNVSTGVVELDIVLEESITELESVTVAADRIKSDAERVKELAFAVNSKEVEGYKNSSKDLNHILNEMQGIRIRETGGMGSRFDLSLNGLSGRQVRYFINGIPVDQLGSSFYMNNIPVNLVERVDVYKGVVPVELGADALGGAINVVTNQEVNNFLDASYSYGSFNTTRAAVNGRHRFKSGFTINSSGYYNYSDNDYRMQNMPVFIKGTEHRREIRRFHDKYESAMGAAEVGFTKVRWADEIMAGITIGSVTQDVQSSIYGTPVGEATQKESNNTLTLKYAKKLLDARLDLKAFLLFNRVNHTSIDTSTNKYDWSGGIINNNGEGELLRDRSIFNYEQEQLLYRINLKYQLHQNHHLNVNQICSSISRQGENVLDKSENEAFKSPNTIKKSVTGIAYETDLLDDKWSNIVAFKYYHFDVLAWNALKDNKGHLQREDIGTTQNRFGYSFASRYFVDSRFLIKASFEKGFRIPEPKEIFGDGLLIAANPFLKPESSLNLNLGANYRKKFNKNVFQVDLNLFQRDVSNFIFMQPQGKRSAYVNVLDVMIHGLELELEHTYDKKLKFIGNFTWQRVLNNEKYKDGTKEARHVYRDKMPNTPYLFANATAHYNLPKIVEKLDFSVYYTMNYVHKFFLQYPSVAKRNKNEIPTQFLNHIGISMSSKEKRYSISLEVRNLFDRAAYDNFNLQKPGRSFSAKLRYFIKET